MRFTNLQLFRFVTWCALAAFGFSQSDQSFTFLFPVGLAFLTIPFVLWGIKYATAESWFSIMVLNSGLLLAIGVGSKIQFGLESPTFLQLFAAVFLFWAAASAMTLDEKKQPARRHFVELLIPSLLGFGCICFAPIVAFPGGEIPILLQLGCLICLCCGAVIYALILQRLTEKAK